MGGTKQEPRYTDHTAIQRFGFAQWKHITLTKRCLNEGRADRQGQLHQHASSSAGKGQKGHYTDHT